MIKKLIRKFKLKNLIYQNKRAIDANGEKKSPNTIISWDFDEKLKIFKQTFEGDEDVNIRCFNIGVDKIRCCIVNIEGLYDKKVINENVLAPLMKDLECKLSGKRITIKNVKDYVVNATNVEILNSMEEAINSVLEGNTLLFLDGESSTLEIVAKSCEHRNVETPQIENSVRGPHEGFNETLSVNIALVRRKIKTPDLKIENFKIGLRTRTSVSVVYIKSLADIKVVEEVKKRLKSIVIDSILESGYIEEFIKDAPLSPFPTVGNTEIPDKLAAKILEGRVGILIDGTPIALTVPYLAIESFQTAEDYYAGPLISTQLRLLRLVSFHISLFLPSLYIALLCFHPNIIPRKLLLVIQVTEEGIPFPAVVEAIGMILLWEVLKEAGVRMPKAVGSALSIVGALIIGQVAVNAGLVSPLMVIVIALIGILSLITPPMNDVVSVLRIPILIIGSTLGLFGVIWCYVLMIIHLASIQSFGTPYMSPMMPFVSADMKDYIIRVPWWLMRTRPKNNKIKDR